MTRLFRLSLGALSALVVFGVTGSAFTPIRADQAPAQVVHVTIDPTVTLGKVTKLSCGINVSVYDSHLMDGSVPGLVSRAGFTVMRYPGGSTSDEYHWRTNTYTPSATNGAAGKVIADNDFDHFIKLMRASGAEPIVTVNYGSNATRTGGGDPNEAAAWVEYSKQKGYNVKYWEIGNELYGNGFYGADWETDLHAPKDGVEESTRKGNPLLGPTEYGKNVSIFARAMKAKDKSAQIGAVLTAPQNWPDGVAPDWNNNVLKECGRDINFAIIHVYPQNNGSESDAGLLDQPEKNAQIIAALRPKLGQYCGRQLPIFVTETNSVNTQPGKQSVSQVNALFAADDVLSFLEGGAANVDWWQLHNGPTTNANNSAQLFGDATFGDYGVLMNGDAPEPAANTPQRTYYAFQMLHDFARMSDPLISAKSDNRDISAYATSHRWREGILYDVLIINKNPGTSYKVDILGAGIGNMEPKSAPLQFSATDKGLVMFTDILMTSNRAEWTMPPYTMTLLEVSRSAK